MVAQLTKNFTKIMSEVTSETEHGKALLHAFGAQSFDKVDTDAYEGVQGAVTRSAILRVWMKALGVAVYGFGADGQPFQPPQGDFNYDADAPYGFDPDKVPEFDFDYGDDDYNEEDDDA